MRPPFEVPDLLRVGSQYSERQYFAVAGGLLWVHPPARSGVPEDQLVPLWHDRARFVINQIVFDPGNFGAMQLPVAKPVPAIVCCIALHQLRGAGVDATA